MLGIHAQHIETVLKRHLAVFSFTTKDPKYILHDLRGQRHVLKFDLRKILFDAF